MFYLSSRGSGASGWISNALSMHPKIVCFQSSRSFPPIRPGYTIPLHKWVEEMSPEKYIDSLEICEESLRGQKVFGSIHGYHGILVKEYCEKKNGFFGYIIRDPLERIHSCWIYNLNKEYFSKHKPELKNEDTFEYIINLLDKDDDFQKYLDYYNQETKSKIKQTSVYKNFHAKFKKFSPNLFEKLKMLKLKKKYLKPRKDYNDEKKATILEFARLCEDFMSKDRILFNNCEFSAGFKMEELINSKEYYKNHFLSKIIDKRYITNDYIQNVFETSKSKIGIHRKKPIRSFEIWKDLPLCLKKIYINYFSIYNVKEISDNFDYKYNYLD
tara:strand:+ start:876 stop:1859 length:984 start_codon:yes stop_codon:yes gene_type:complete